MTRTTYMQTQRLFGTTVELRLVADREATANAGFAVLWQKMYDFNERYSRFLPHSEVSVLNQHAGEQVPISEELHDILTTVLQLGAVTNGLFNPFTLPVLQRSGYLHSLDGAISETPVYFERSVPSIEELELGTDWAQLPKGSAIDLGGIGKGYCADQLRSLAASHSTNYCLSLGGDIAVAGKDSHGPWEIDVESFTDPNKVVATCDIAELASYGIATSGQFRRRRGEQINHIVDPRQGKVLHSTELVSCTVVANDTTTADVLASCVLIGGEELAKQYVEMEEVLAVLVQRSDGGEPVVYSTTPVFSMDS